MKTTTRESLKGRMSVFAITMALLGLTLSGSTMALTGSLEDPVDSLTDAEYGLEDLLGMSMASAPVPGLTIRQIGVDESRTVEVVEPGIDDDPLGSIWIVNVSHRQSPGTFVHLPLTTTQPWNSDQDPCSAYSLLGLAWWGIVNLLSEVGDDVPPPADDSYQDVLNHAAVLWWQVDRFSCEPVAHVSDIIQPEEEFVDDGLRLCLNRYYVGLDVLPPEGQDNFGTDEIRILELRTNSTCE